MENQTKNLFDIRDRVIVITGGYGVLGSSMARYLATQGAKVAIVGRSLPKGQVLSDSISSGGYQAAFFQADVTDEASVEACCSKVLEKYKKIDVLINAAGGNLPGATIPPDKTIFDLNMSDFRQVVDLNLSGTVIPTLQFAKAMLQQKAGNIINISSETSLRPLTRVVGYGAAKAAINNFTQYMAGELALKFGNGFRVNALAPGFFITDQNRDLLTNADGSYTDRAETILKHTPFNRFGEADELLGSLHYLASDASRFVTGTVLVVDGGFNAFSI